MMMIRSTRIPSILNRIIQNDANLLYALLVTVDGELLGVSNCSSKSTIQQQQNPDAFGTLLADIALDYHRLGEELSSVDNSNNNKSYMECLLIEMELGLVGVTSCAGCFVIAVGRPDTPLGMMKERLQTLTITIEESFSAVTVVS